MTEAAGTTYRALVAQDPQAPFKDNVGSIFFNGIPTMRKKTYLAYEKGGRHHDLGNQPGRDRGASPGRHDLRIYSASGNLVHTARFLAAAQEGTIPWNATGLPAGVYAISLDGIDAAASRLILSAP